MDKYSIKAIPFKLEDTYYFINPGGHAPTLKMKVQTSGS